MTRRLAAPSLLALLALSGCPAAHFGTDGGIDASRGDPDSGDDPRDAGLDSGDLGDGGAPIATCEPMDARIDVCADVCFGVTSAFWDGASCVAAHCDCAGSECDVYPTVEACEAAHAGCDATLCSSTGGAWFDRLEWCGHFECGVPAPAACETPTRACDCGTYRVFMEGVGCVDGPLCELRAPREPDVLCADTGGTWMPGICGHATCGRLSDLDCASPGCVCGALEVFDDERGCIRSPTCDVRQLGESCDESGRCGDGSVCCATGGASAASTCVAPMCDDPSGICGPPRP